MNITSIPKFVVNLERRPDRLEHIQKEMDYMGWDYELFKAVDLNNHMVDVRYLTPRLLKLRKNEVTILLW